MQSKKLKQLAVLVLVFCALLTFYTWFSSNKDKKKEKDNEEDTVEATEIFNVDKDELTEIEYKYDKKNYKLIYNKKDKEWDLKDKEKWPINQDTVGNMQAAVEKIMSVKDIKSTKASDFGLDKPSKIVTLKVKEDKKIQTHKMIFGKEAPNSLGYYFMLDGEEKIYVVGHEIYQSFEFDENGLLEVESITGISSDAIFDVDIKSDALTVKAKYEGDIKSADGKWIISKPYKKTQNGISSTFTEYFVNYESLAFGDKVIDYKPKNLKKYGLDKPSITASIKYFEEIETKDDKEDESGTVISDKKKTFTLLVGKKVKSENDDDMEQTSAYYVMKKGGDRVYTMESSYVESLTSFKAFNFVDKTVNSNDLLNYSNMKLVVGKDEYVMSKVAVETKNKDGEVTVDYEYKLNGKEIKVTKAEEITNKLYGLSYESEIASDNIDKDTIKATLTFKAKEKGKKDLVIKFLNYDDSHYRVNKDGEVEFTIKKDSVEDFIKVIKNNVKK